MNFYCPNFVLKGFFWLGNDFKGLSLIKLKLISFFIARYLLDGTGIVSEISLVLFVFFILIGSSFIQYLFVSLIFWISLQK